MLCRLLATNALKITDGLRFPWILDLSLSLRMSIDVIALARGQNVFELLFSSGVASLDFGRLTRWTHARGLVCFVHASLSMSLVLLRSTLQCRALVHGKEGSLL